ncbi:MAG TPA: endopeptidase La [Haliangiales bacterium]|nr:endopeptidase La [Haliangiales bacterium]
MMVRLPILPLRNLAIFPGIVQPVDIGRPGSLKLIEDVTRFGAAGARFVVVTQKDAAVDDPKPEDLHPAGVEVEVVKVVRQPDNRLTVVVRGIERVRLATVTQHTPYIAAQVEVIGDVVGDPIEVDGLSMAVREAAKQMIELSPEIPGDAKAAIDQMTDAARLADMVAANLDLSIEDKQALIAEPSVKVRLERVLGALHHRIEVFKVKEKIDTQVREELSKQQREAVLRQKLKAIQEELGEIDQSSEDQGELADKIREAKMPEEVEKVAKKQLSRLGQMQSASPEYTVTRTYLEWLIEVPWTKETEDKLDLNDARAILDADHYDLDRVKKRIIEYLAVRKLAPGKKGPILCLVGPPGVGKTSLGRSIARALGREFARMSLGGVRDEAEIRGHRRTYIGALPGRIIQTMKKAGTRNPVVVLDEIDKLGADFRGDPSAALLEVLDPEQNFSFSDHYLEVAYDLSRVLWIATANQLDPIPPALRDRLEIIELPGYTMEDKKHIAKKFLLPKELKEHGITEHHLQLTDAALDEVIEHYTREAGVRNLEREIATICRQVAVKVASGEDYRTAIDAGELSDILGPPKFFSEIAERTEVPGVATGLAWTPVGGDILFVEATKMTGKGQLVLTGQLGDVMKESAQAALSFVRSHAQDLGIQPDFFEKSDIHVHIPAGGIPKDGPSAGVTMLSAMVSLLTGRRVHGDVAMTGEISLRGQVLPVGGIKEKVLAAHRAGVTRVLLPERNRKDLVEIPEGVRKELELTFVRRMDEVLPLVLEPKGSTRPETTASA